MELNKKTLTLTVVMLVAAGTGAATLMDQFGTVTGDTTVKQSLTVDGNSYDNPVSYGFGSSNYAGTTHVSTHTIQNNGGVPVAFKFNTTQDKKDTGDVEGDVEGIKTRYYAGVPSTDTSDFAHRMDGSEKSIESIYGSKMSVEQDFNNGRVEYTIDLPDSALSENPDNTALLLDSDNDGTADFQVTYKVGTGFGYQEVSDGGWTSPSMPGSFSTSADEATGTVTVSMPTGRLGGLSSDYRYLANAIDQCSPDMEDAGQCGGSEAQLHMNNGQTKDPFGTQQDTSWTSSVNYVNDVVGEQVTGWQTVEGGESVNYAFTNQFDTALMPGDYEITTDVLPQ